MGNTEQDAMWVERTLETLPSVPVPAALETRILGDFDRVAARRGAGLAGLLVRLRDTVWPGAPLWRPAAVLAAALVIGMTAGIVVPLEDEMSEGSEQTASVALDAPPAFELGENS
jgi:hypothetical protein